MLKSVEKTFTTDSAGNATLFSGSVVKVIAILSPTGCFLPFWGYGNTYVKALSMGGQTPTGVASTQYTVTVLYIE